jgi:hypothetical protein
MWVARTRVHVKKPSGKSTSLGEHWTGTGRINIKPEVLDSVGAPPETKRARLESIQAQGWWPPADKQWTLSDTVMAHELGHGVADRGLKAVFGGGGAGMWKAIADGIGIMPPFGLENKDQWEYEKALNRWIGSNKAKIAREVSTYATTNMSELLAELWQEYTLNQHPRPAARAYGDWVMRFLKDREVKP